MKKLLLICAVAVFMTACNSSDENLPSADNAGSDKQDTTGLAAFQQWKNQQPIVAEQTQEIESNLIKTDEPKTKIIYRQRPTSNTIKRNKIAATESTNEPVAATEKVETYGAPVVKPREAVSKNGSGFGGETGATGNEGVSSSEEPAIINTSIDNPSKNEGWRKAAKGTVIGAASGAVLGAIISKKKGTGAIIDGALSALGGYIFGRLKDKKVGRY